MTFGPKLAWDDTVLPFQLDATNMRGRVARLDGVLDGILKQHDYPPAVEALVSAISFPLETWSQWEEGISEQGGSSPRAVREAADKWIEENKDTYESWLAQARQAAS